AVALVERQPIEMQAIGDGPVVQFQGDLRLGAVGHRIRNPRFPAAATIRRPTLGQEQLPVEQAVEVLDGIAQMHGDQAVFELAEAAAPLLLYPRCFVAFLGVAGLIEEADRMRPRVFGPDDLLDAIAQPIIVPLELAEELLQRAGRDSRLQGDRLDALLGKVGELSTNIHSQVSTGVLAGETVGEPTQEAFEFRFQLADLLSIHARSSVRTSEDSSFADSSDPSKVNIAL